MLEQIKQVSLTYLTQRLLWWGFAIFSLMAVPQLMLSLTRHGSTADAASPMVMLLGMPMFTLIPFLVGQIKMQFGHSRARLMPQFFPAHLTVLGGILFTAFVLFPILLAQLNELEPVGLLALSLAIGVPALWGAQLNRFSAMLVSLLVFYSLLTNWGLHWWIVDASMHRGALAFIAIAGVVLVIAWLWRLCHLNEEMADYQNLYAAILARRTGSEAIEQRRVVATQVSRSRLIAQAGDWWHDRIGGYYGGSMAGLVRVLRYGFSAAPVEIQGLFMAMMIAAVGLFLSRFSVLSQAGSNIGAMFFFIQFSVLLPAQTAGEMMAQRRPRMANEMLLPLSRTQLINGLFAASARNSFALWVMMNGSLLFVLSLQENPVSLATVGMFLLLSVSTMIAAMGIALRVATRPSMAIRMMVLFPCCILLLGPMAAWWNLRGTAGDWPFACVAVAMIALGAGIIYEARRVWLQLELG